MDIVKDLAYAARLLRKNPAFAVTAIVTLTAAIGLYFRIGVDTKFDTTPTDVLIALGVLALIVSGGISNDSRATVQLIVCAAVLMYGYEIVVRLAQQRALHLTILATLTIIALRGVL